MGTSLTKLGFRGGRQLLGEVGKLRRGGLGGPWFLAGFGRGLGDLGGVNYAIAVIFITGVTVRSVPAPSQ